MTRYLEPRLRADWGPQPHVLQTARQNLKGTVIDEEVKVLNNRPVSIWIDLVGFRANQKSQIEREAARKRRLYRTYLSWTSDTRLSGAIAERHVAACLHAAHVAKALWVPKFKPGRVREIAGRDLGGRTADAVGYCPKLSDDPTAGAIPFAVEIKNIRSWIYPWDSEMWDLLTTVSTRPDVLPVLVARRIHPISFHFIADVGAFGYQFKRHFFAWSGTADDSFTADALAEIAQTFGFKDASRLQDPDSAMIGDPPRPAPLVNWLTAHLTRQAAFQAPRWEVSAPIVERYKLLRDEDLDASNRRGLWSEFCTEIRQAGLYKFGGWAPRDFESENGDALLDVADVDDLREYDDY